MLRHKMIHQTAAVLFLFTSAFLNGFLNAEPSCSTDQYLNDCGYLGIQQDECEAKGCCWNPGVSPGSPWCFYANGGYNQCSLTAERRNCGDGEIEESECTARGCCWDENEIGGELPCFYPNSANSPDECPSDVDRVECGYVGITRDICEANGCCWSPLDHWSNEPWCFEKPAAVVTANADFDTCCPDSRRSDCGFSGISERECLDKGCCYDPYERSGSGPWCYHRNCRNPALESCAADDYRIECGNKRLGEQGCRNRGCCYSPKDNSPWCFFQNSGPNPYDTCCPSYDRVECGFYGITEGQCNERGCCWSPLEESSAEPWCFRQNCIDPSLDVCSPQGPRIDCGYYGIDQAECENKGCCWGPLEEGSQAPWCFFRNYEVGQCCDASASRVECGYLGIDQQECESRECCWSPLEEGSAEPWCFYLNSDACGAFVQPGSETETVTTLSTEETEETAPAEGSVSAATGEDIFGEIAASMGQTREEYTAAAAEAAGFESAEYELEVERLGMALASQIEVDLEFTIIPQPELVHLAERMESEVNSEINEGEKIGCSLCGKEKKEGYTKSSIEVTNTTVEELIPATLGPKWIGTSKPIGTKETETEEGSKGKSEGKGETSHESGVSGTESEEEVSTIGTESTGKPSVGASHKEEDESAKSGSSTSLSKGTKEESGESDESESGEGFETETKTLSSSQSFKEKTHTPEGTAESTGTESETTQDIKGHGKGAETEVKTTMRTKTKTHTGSFAGGEGAEEMFACTTIIRKIKCGENGIDEEACLAMDCCWQKDATGIFPSCYKKGST